MCNWFRDEKRNYIACYYDVFVWLMKNHLFYHPFFLSLLNVEADKCIFRLDPLILFISIQIPIISYNILL